MKNMLSNSYQLFLVITGRKMSKQLRFNYQVFVCQYLVIKTYQNTISKKKNQFCLAHKLGTIMN